MPAAVLDAAAAAIGGKMYVVGGKTSAGHQSTLYIYDPATDNWTTGPSMPGTAVEDPAVVAHNNLLYVFGGGPSPFTGAVTQAYAYNPQTPSWSSRASMNVARSGATAQVIGGLIYVAGGLDASGASLSSVSVYNPGTNSWSSGTAMNVRRDNAVSAAFGGMMYVFGGRTRNADGSSPAPGLTSVEMFNPSTNSWSFREPMPTGRRRMIIGTIGGRAQISGGERTSEEFPEHEEYDPGTNTWRELTPLLTPRHGAAFATINGVLYAAGGGPVTGLSFTDVNEAFFP
jgi:N-acetylneuraminic acid mutarotase